MSVTATSLSEATRSSIKAQVESGAGFPRLPHVPYSPFVKLTPEEQEANLLHVALWVVERAGDSFDMKQWHGLRIGSEVVAVPSYSQHRCNTTHCIAGFAEVMSNNVYVNCGTENAGAMLLGLEAYSHFLDTNEDGLEFLKEVIARNS